MDVNIQMLRRRGSGNLDCPFPDDYGMVGMTRGDQGLWADVWRDVEQKPQYDAAFFHKEFGDDWDDITARCFFLQDQVGCTIGTISAWHGPHRLGTDIGRIHWVAIRRSHQGRRLARPMTAHALGVLDDEYPVSYLVTQPYRIPAINLYLSVGFEPDLKHAPTRDAWPAIEVNLTRPRERS